MTTSSPAASPNGLQQRYRITKADGSPCDPSAFYFVLRCDHGGSDPVHIEACRSALEVYANKVSRTHLSDLGKDLLSWLVETLPKKEEQR